MKKIGLIGCGNISETYLKSQNYFNNIFFESCADINEDVARKCADKYNIRFTTVDEMFNDKNIDIILNLTTPAAHYEIIKRTLRDMFDDNTKNIIIEGNEGYKKAQSFMKTMMPSSVKKVKKYRGKIP